MNDRRRGQVLPLFAIFLIGLFALAALAVDVSSAYSARQAYRTAADAASLAGAQDLQAAATRAVTSTERLKARTDALKSLVTDFGASAPTCDPNNDIADCPLPGTPFKVSIKTPSPTCVTCDPTHSVQVTVDNPAFQLTFARVLGIRQWNVASASVAGLTFGRSYALMTLRPPTGTGALPDVRDIEINGGTHVTIDRGDVGSNANMLYSGSGSKLFLDPDYGMYYYDPFNAPLWSSPPNPPAKPRLTSLITDPNYTIPSSAGGPVGAPDTAVNCAAAAAVVFSNAKYAPSVPVTGLGLPDMTKIQCYKPGKYAAEVTINNGNLGILQPGLYFFNGGLNAQGSVIGGFAPNSPGVALVFPETQGTMFRNRTGGGGSLQQVVALNAGSKYLNASGTEAIAARDYAGNPIQTNTTPALLMTVIVQKDANCIPVLPLPAACDNREENQNKAIDLSGGSGMYLAGVQYAVSDGISIAGNTSSGGYVGQIIAWTVFYTGGSDIRQEGPGGPNVGIIRLDAACTIPGIACAP